MKIYIAAIQEELKTGEVKSLKWIPGSLQLANIMTKQGAASFTLLEVLQSGKMTDQIVKIAMEKLNG